MLTIDTSVWTLTPASKLNEIIDALMARHMSRYPVRVEPVSDNEVHFHDSRNTGACLAEASIAMLMWDGEKYLVWSKRVENKRMRHWNNSFHTTKTKKVDKVINKLLELSTSFTDEELARVTYRDMATKYGEWKADASMAFHDAVRRYVGVEEIMDDILGTLQGAAPYQTALQHFSDEKSVALFKEYRARETAPRPMVNVFVNPDGVTHVMRITEQHFLEATNPSMSVTKFNSFDAIPQAMQEACALLRLVEGDTFVRDVGYKHVAYNSFWIYA